MSATYSATHSSLHTFVGCVVSSGVSPGLICVPSVSSEPKRPKGYNLTAADVCGNFAELCAFAGRATNDDDDDVLTLLIYHFPEI